MLHGREASASVTGSRRREWRRALACAGVLLGLVPAAVGATTPRATHASQKSPAKPAVAPADTSGAATSPNQAATSTSKAAASPNQPATSTSKAAASSDPAAAGSQKAADKAGAEDKTAAKSSGKGKMTMTGGQEGTAFGSLTVEGEDKIHIEFERPELDLHLDPRQTQGLELGNASEILDRQPVDLTTTMLQASAQERSPYIARPWLDELASGPVARFRPAVEGVERWKLVVADSRGQSVREYAGQGKPPKEIVWDGSTVSGQPALPGLTYSYVFEAFDRAGNKRNFVGEGFQVPPYRRSTPSGLTMLFSGAGLQSTVRSTTGQPPQIVLEAASWINQVSRVDYPVRVKASARTFEMATALSQTLVQQLAPLVIGDPARIQGLTDVQPDAPAQGTIAVTVGP
jgi:hypothetical protein